MDSAVSYMSWSSGGSRATCRFNKVRILMTMLMTLIPKATQGCSIEYLA